MAKKIILTNSKIHGSGVFAARDIVKGEIVFILKGKKINFFVKNEKDALSGENWIGLGANLWLDVRSPGVYLNHSCEPNCGIKGSVCVVAMYSIKKGEEITIDYSITEQEQLWHLKCDCGTKKCRKKIKSIQSLPPQIFLDYQPYVPNFFARIYNNANRIK